MVWLVLANHEHRLAQTNRNVNPFFKKFFVGRKLFLSRFSARSVPQPERQPGQQDRGRADGGVNRQQEDGVKSPRL